MKIKELFKVSDEKIREKDEKKIKWLYDRANSEVNVHIAKDNKMWLTIDSVPILEVTTETNFSKRTISITDLEGFIKQIRDSWVETHKNDRTDFIH